MSGPASSTHGGREDRLYDLLPADHRMSYDMHAILRAIVDEGELVEFQEHLGGRLTIMLLKGIGEPFDVHEIRTDLVARSISLLKSLEAERARSTAQKAS